MKVERYQSVCGNSVNSHIKSRPVPTSQDVDSRSRTGFTLIELLVVMAITGILVGISLPAVQSLRESARKTECQDHLRQIALGAAGFEASFKHFPPGQLAPAVDTDFDANQCLGHLGYIMPFVELGNLQKIQSFDWNVKSVSPAWYLDTNTWDAFSIRVPLFRCPSDGEEVPEAIYLSIIPYSTTNAYKLENLSSPFNGWTNYLGCSGDVVIGGIANRTGGIFYSRSQTRAGDIADGLSNTILLGEVIGATATIDGQALGVARARHSFMGNGIGNKWGYFFDVPGDNQDTSISTYSSRHSGQIANFAFADGHVAPIARHIQNDELAALMTRNGGEIVKFDF